MATVTVMIVQTVTLLLPVMAIVEVILGLTVEVPILIMLYRTSTYTKVLLVLPLLSRLYN